MSNRNIGRKVYARFLDTYNSIVMVRGTSIGGRPHCWVNAIDNPETDQPTPYLDVEQAKQLRDALDLFIKDAEDE